MNVVALYLVGLLLVMLSGATAATYAAQNQVRFEISRARQLQQRGLRLPDTLAEAVPGWDSDR